MSGVEFLARLKGKFGDGIVSADLEAIDPWIGVSPESLPSLCAYLKSEEDLAFDMCNCITVVDHLITDPKKAAKSTEEPRLDVVYHLTSIRHKHSLVVKVALPRWQDGVEGQCPSVPTVAGIWRTADWHERETYDLSGVWFEGHPDLRRILLPEDWEGYPLRKDYEMPQEYHGIRGR
ncbi:MAG: NADH-quinone oxidoreductase subunit C [Planctomycetales bacterium]|nr:NADH-quinone oxidoreductase subunit C [Planctomycetales bacterium]